MNDRERLIERLNACGKVFYSTGELIDYLTANGMTIQKHGRWENAICTACDFDLRCLTDGENDLEQWVWDEGFDFCPNCGAKMDLEEDNAKT